MTNRKKEFVAISDFHSYTYPLDKIKKYYLNEFNYIYILGDATDRGKYGDGTGGIELLEEIKELTEKYPGRIIYIPGNHDEFLVGYAKGINNYERNLIYNGGEQTIRDLKELKIKNPYRYKELINWLSKLPIQRTHKHEGKNYVFAHALFNQKLYEYDPNYCLEDYFQEDNKKINKMVDDILWFRKGEVGSYSASELPSSDSIMVIGHTPTKYRKGSLDLETADGNMVKVQCVDGGIAYDGVMLKYMSGDSKTTQTNFFVHVPPEFDGDNEITVKDVLLPYNNGLDSTIMKDSLRFLDRCVGIPMIETTLEKLRKMKDILLNPELESLYCATPLLRKYIQRNSIKYTNEKSNEEINKYVGTKDFSYTSDDFYIKYADYVKIVLLDYIIKVQMKKYGDDVGIDRMDAVLFNTPGVYTSYNGETVENTVGRFTLFTRTDNCRMAAMYLGLDGIKYVLQLHNCSTVKEYVEEKLKYKKSLDKEQSKVKKYN